MKRILSVILCAVLTLSCFSVISAETEATQAPIAHGDLAAPSNWAMDYVSKADSIGMTDYFKVPWTNNITREQFCHLAYNMLDRAKNIEWKKAVENPFEDTDNEKVLSLYLEGIIEGKDGKIFAPQDEITREEAAAILARIADCMELPSTEMYFEFADIGEISDWASHNVQRVCNLGVMHGVGDNRFSPKSGYTVEQAVVTLVRLFDLISEDKFAYMTFADKMNVNMPKDSNYMFSPLSVKMALMMLANGAEGKTRTEILDAINVQDMEHYNTCIMLMMADYSRSDMLKIDVANSIWINSNRTSQRFSQEYQNKLSKFFGAESNVVSDDEAVDKINGWVKEKTQDRISGIVSEQNRAFWTMLVNAVYFKGRWAKEFNKNATAQEEFTSKDGNISTIDFMNKMSWMPYGVNKGVTIVELPYLSPSYGTEKGCSAGGGYPRLNVSMYLMMGDNDFLPEEILDETELNSKYIKLSVPKFSMEYSTSINDILKTIGINKAFDKSAEFENMFDSGTMWIDSTIHKTYIKVDEEGTEAAAVTGIGMAGSSLPPEPVIVKYNRPFTFVIRDNTSGEILFMGEYAFADENK